MNIEGPITLNIDSFAITGEGIGEFSGKQFKVIGSLPQEVVQIKILKRKKGIFFAEPELIIKPIAYRCEPREPHYLSGSPWQIIPEEKQIEIKRGLALEIFLERAGDLPLESVEISPSPLAWGYRNKMEFSFSGRPDGRVGLAFHKRYRKYDLYPVEGSQIAAALINVEAQRVVKSINKKQIPASELKSLVLRYSFSSNSCVAALYVKNENTPVVSGLVSNKLAGFSQVYSDPNSPASVKTKTIHSEGNLELKESLNGKEFCYPYDGFFQVNPKAFEQLAEYLNQALSTDKNVLDLYSGVGTIGILLSDKAKQVVLVESQESSTQMAEENIKLNKADNTAMHLGEVEKQDLRDLLEKTDVLVVDPPRSGMHPRLVRRILEKPPEQILYVSCNPHTQAQNWKELKRAYHTQAWKIFDLYPQTPHMESVLILRRNV